MTLDVAKVKLNRVFAPGQVYVGLSRARSLEGLQVEGFKPADVIASEQVRKWMNQKFPLNPLYTEKSPDKENYKEFGRPVPKPRRMFYENEDEVPQLSKNVEETKTKNSIKTEKSTISNQKRKRSDFCDSLESRLKKSKIIDLTDDNDKKQVIFESKLELDDSELHEIEKKPLSLSASLSASTNTRTITSDDILEHFAHLDPTKKQELINLLLNNVK